MSRKPADSSEPRPQPVTAVERVWIRVVQRLGKGGFGDVYRVRPLGDPSASDLVVQLLRESDSDGGRERDRLNDGARFLSIIDHPAVVRVLGILDVDGRLGLVTELVEGSDLRRVIERAGPLPVRAVTELVAIVAEALHAAHTAQRPDGEPLGLIHRDVKPANVMVTPQGRLVLLDFDIPHTDATQGEATSTHIAPELIGNEPPTSAADVWSLAMTAYEALSGQRLFENLDTAALDALIRSGDPQAQVLERLVPLDLPAELLALLIDMTALDAADRVGLVEVAERARAALPGIDGDSLEAWAAAQDWPPIQTPPTELDGEVLHGKLLPVPHWPGVTPVDDEDDLLGEPLGAEDDLELDDEDAAETPAPESSRPPSQDDEEGMGMLPFLVLLPIGVVVLCLFGGSWFASETSDPAPLPVPAQAAPAPAPVPAPAPAMPSPAVPEDTDTPDSDEEPAAAPAPAPSGRPRPGPSPSPQNAPEPTGGPVTATAAPQPAPSTEPEPEPEPDGRTRKVVFQSKDDLFVRVAGQEGATPFKVDLPLGTAEVVVSRPGQLGGERRQTIDVSGGIGPMRITVSLD